MNIPYSNRGKKPPRYQHKIADHKRLWHIWNGIKKRCLRNTEPRYKDYGGRGIIIDPDWLNFDNFAGWALSHGYTDELTIERIDVDGNYCPENCKWITRQEQRLNTRNNIRVYYDGKMWVLSELCKAKGVSYDLVHDRVRDKGWDIKAAIETPPRKSGFPERCRKAGLKPSVVNDRLRLGWSEADAFNTPDSGLHVRILNPQKAHGICEYCGKEYIRRVGSQKYCCKQCCERAKKKRNKAVYVKQNILTVK